MQVIKTEVNFDDHDLLDWRNQNRGYFAPAIWDAKVAPSSYFQSGVGYNDDIQVKAVNRNWFPLVKTGHYYIRDKRYYLYSYNDMTSHFHTTLSDTDFAVSGNGYYVYNISVDTATKGYYGYKPAFVGNFKRENDTLYLNNSYRQRRVFSNIEASGYVDVEDILPSSCVVTGLEFMLDRVNVRDEMLTVTGSIDGRYYEDSQVAPVNMLLALNDISNITGYTTDTFTINNDDIIYCKLKYVPVAEVSSVSITYNDVVYPITGYTESSYLPGLIQIDNIPSGGEGWDRIYPSGTVDVVYKPGLYVAYDNTYSNNYQLPITVNPLEAGGGDYYVLLTHKEVDPTRVQVLGGRKHRCFVAGLPMAFKVKTSFNEAPILNYPVTVEAGISRISTNDLVLTNSTEIMMDGDGYGKFYYVPPKEVDDESFYFNLGMYTAVMNVGSYIYPNGPTGIVHGVGYVGSTAPDEDTFRNTIFLPTSKPAKQFFGSTLFSIYDVDKVKNNDFIGCLGVLKIRGVKQTTVVPVKLPNRDEHSMSNVNVLSLAKPTNQKDIANKYLSEHNFKFRTNNLNDLTVTFRPYGTAGTKLMVFLNDALIGIFTDNVDAGKFHTDIVEFDLTKEYRLNEKHTFLSDTIYLNGVIPSGYDTQGPFAITDVSGNTYSSVTDYTLSGNKVSRLIGGSIPASGDVYIDYLVDSNHVYTDTVNNLRFITTDPNFLATDWNVVDVYISNNSSLKSWDNDYTNALPIGFYKRNGTQLEFIALDQVGDDTMVDAILYHNLPHSVQRYSPIIGYYIYLPGKDYITAHTYTSYGNTIYSSVYGVVIDAPDYMKGYYGNPEIPVMPNTPYSTIQFFQVVK